MSNYDFLPTDKAIEQAVLSIKNQYGLIQRLAEEYFDIRENLKFRPIGRNSDNVTTKNYPDAYAIQPDERLAIAEATTGDWRKHILKDDLPRLKALGKGRVGMYRLFAVANEEALIKQKSSATKKKSTKTTTTTKKSARPTEDSLRQSIATECGIQIDDVEFVFLRQFIKEVRDPKYLRILILLKLPVSSAPFFFASDYLPVGISEIMPNAAEFVAGEVVPEESVTSLLEVIKQKKRVVLEGRGASGKTSLALAVAHRWNSTGTSFYIDLDSYDLCSPQAQRELISAGAFFGAAQSLFILDNCHKANQQQLEAVLTAWKNLAIDPHILMTRRETAVNYGRCVSSASLIRHEISRADFLAAYRRLVKRRSGSESAPMPPMQVLSQWATWKGDLIAFCLALLPTLHAKGSSTNWELSIDHAVRYVRNTYITPLSDSERAVLIKIALLARFEMPTSFRGLGFIEPKQALAAGIVLESRHGSQPNRVRFSLPHYQLGELILADISPSEKAEVLRDIALRDPFQAAYIARKMREINENENAKSLLLMVEEKLLTFSQDFSPAYLGTISQLYVDYDLRSASEIEKRLLAAMDSFLPSNMNPVDGLANFLAFAKSEMPSLYASTAAKIADSTTVSRICEQMANAVPSSVASLVRFAQNNNLPCATSLLLKVNQEKVLTSLATRLSTQPARDIEKFLEFVITTCEKQAHYFEKVLVQCPDFSMSSKRVLALPLSNILEMIDTAPSASAIAFKSISIDDWRARDWVLEKNLPSLVGPTANRIGLRFRRSDLVAEMAKRAMQYWNPRAGVPSRVVARELAVLMRNLPLDEECGDFGQFTDRLNSADNEPVRNFVCEA